jgi:hypothetical protein
MKDIYRLTLQMPDGKEVSCKCTPNGIGSFIAPQDFEAIDARQRQPFLFALRKKYDVIGTAADGFRVFQPRERKFEHGKADNKGA